MKHLTNIEDKVAAGGEPFKQYVLRVYKTPWHALSDETLRQALKDFPKDKELNKKLIEILGHEHNMKEYIKFTYATDTFSLKKDDKVTYLGTYDMIKNQFSDKILTEAIKNAGQWVKIDHEKTKKKGKHLGDTPKKIKHLGEGPSLTDPKAYDLFLNLKQFTGTENWYKHPLSGYTYTDGVKYLAEKGEAYWLIDKILLTMKHEAKLQLQDYQEFTSWRLLVNEDRTATLTAEDGNNHEIYSEKIDYTDFPLQEIMLWFENGVLILPSEH